MVGNAAKAAGCLLMLAAVALLWRHSSIFHIEMRNFYLQQQNRQNRTPVLE